MYACTKLQHVLIKQISYLMKIPLHSSLRVIVSLLSPPPSPHPPTLHADPM